MIIHRKEGARMKHPLTRTLALLLTILLLAATLPIIPAIAAVLGIRPIPPAEVIQSPKLLRK
jgi:hypothetical protein